MQSGAKYIFLKVKVKRRTVGKKPVNLRLHLLIITKHPTIQPFTYDKACYNFYWEDESTSLHFAVPFH